MLELLLMTYQDYFGVSFPLADFTDRSEIEVINILYDCVQNNEPYRPGMTVPENRFPEAPGLHKNET